ncbi:DNA repair and recombination protein RadB [archaeon]|nr:DNA repair and recombination protein RadB [archaeon]
MVDIISTGCGVSDELLKGGIEAGFINTIYGPGSSGKTTLCMQAAIDCIKEGFKVVYMDTENGFNPERFSQLAGEKFKEILEKIIFIKINSYEDQYKKIKSLNQLKKENSIRLFIIDTIGNYYRSEQSIDAKEKNAMMLEQLGTIRGIAKENNKFILMANQVYSKLNENKIEPVGGKIITNFNNCLIEFTMDDEKKREMILRKYTSYNREMDNNISMGIKFKIVEKGIVYDK